MPLPAPLPPDTAPAPTIALDADAAERLRRLRAEATAANTARAQRSDTRYLTAWAERRLGLDLTDPAALPLPAETVVTFVLDHVDLTGDGISLPATVDAALVAAGVKRRPGPLGLATTERRLATLAALHRARGVPSPTLHPGVRDLLRQARRALAARGITPQAKRAATRDEVLGPMLDALPDDARGLRDRAILAVAFASGGRRRSELVALRLADVTAAGRDFTLRIRRSKTDQQGAGTDVPVKRAAADALRRWLRLLADQGITDGPLFRELSRRGRVVRRRGAEGGAKPLDGRVVAEVVKRAARAAGLDPAAYAAHSLRSGFLTTGGRDGIPLDLLMQLSGHKSHRIAARYFQAGAVHQNPAADLL
ncbi:tyrosine-type recombinase/integrase (plasmid) [Azospirillum sp. A29]|uniref:tyrosine-type recombinase/integrase n=1 Tax=Azospirillum sp. A29 TaxID=3160606 RepID=UPI003672F319